MNVETQKSEEESGDGKAEASGSDKAETSGDGKAEASGNGKAEASNGNVDEAKKALTHYKSKIGESIREEVIRVIETGDPNKEGAFTANVAARVERMIRAGRELLLAEQIPLDGLKSVLKKRRGYGGGIIGGNPIMGNSLVDMDDGGMLLGEGDEGPLMQSGPSENFGMVAIRELISGLHSNQDTPEKLVKALSLARAEGLDDVAASLEKKLGVEKEAPGLKKEVPKESIKEEGEALP